MGGPVRKEDIGAERQASREIWGREFIQPHQLRPSFEFSEWILVSYARKARASPTPWGSPHTLLCPPSHQEPSNKGVRNRGLGSSGGGVRWEEGKRRGEMGGGRGEMGMDSDGAVGALWKGGAHRPSALGA